MQNKNVIFILLDQFRYDCINEYEIFQKLRSNAVYCSNMYTAMPYTIGSLHALFSGLYGFANGVDGYLNSHKYKKYLTIPELLAQNGYHTICTTPSSLCIPEQGINELIICKENETEYESLHKKILKSISHDRTSFFLFLHYNAIHTSMQKEYLKHVTDTDKYYFSQKEKNLAYYKMQTAKAADYLENILHFIKKIGLIDESIIIVLTDHGCSVGDRIGEKAYGIYTYNYTAKVWAYIIDSECCKNINITQTTRTIDIFPTILDMLHIEVPNHLFGKSIFQRDDVEREAFIETGGIGGYNPSPTISNIYSLAYKEKKIIYNWTTQEYEFYDLLSDNTEEKNIYDEQDPKCEEMRNRLKKYRKFHQQR